LFSLPRQILFYRWNMSSQRGEKYDKKLSWCWQTARRV